MTTHSTSAPITVAHGDGIGPEIMEATLSVLHAAGAALDIDTITIGESVYQAGNPAGVTPEALESIRRTGVFLKAPITTPQGGGFKSLNVTVRKTFGLYANVRPCVAYAPFVATKHPGMDVVIVRENEEDLYAGIEHRQTDEVVQCLKLISRQGCERVIRYAFEYATAYRRTKVTAFTKDNIMKMTDGLFHRVFDEVAADYPDIQAEHWIVDIGAAKLADTPEAFDVVVLPNLYGDILSDIAAQIAGSVGLAGSANIGERVAMFEAIHGSAPRRAGQDVANPSGLLLAAVQMLVHIRQADVASRVHNAWLRTIEDGIHTYDIYEPDTSTSKVGTTAFAASVIDRLGQEPTRLPATHYAQHRPITVKLAGRSAAAKTQLGVDVFVHSPDTTPDELAAKLRPFAAPLHLDMISNRGQKVWPGGAPETLLTDHWRCRFLDPRGTTTAAEVVALQARMVEHGIEPIKTEGLYAFDGEPAFTRGQGQ
ncbi:MULTISPECIES: NADP-dependent isocitrate dehydrogenase [Pseudonocardia]|uniref:Isocitrate dehydrogenase [NADP] n=2 Tax=Pseudonocardia TaxID=1847 RepID=A0A1Y2MGL3_PSEAH|nr:MULTISPECIES: NADP-dependent isocitrate dehydrogenase [Pseudonocardia]OSY34424.1 Isocitrate dehydrogenase [NADP] [Pseudonocardia autotrophica]OZM75479.1 isocitrate dehydrogenase [Pseudonocardia sp. MH-G8]TDN77188.1 isocitrate dehydrogenase [Pseudonocardia autotrophica]BBG01201.1 isocitrate dehydrogenase [Pseudonocardia autotrophica]GEC29678.1 isocitrate dehydrogenase [Pseudonocardia saturnea]